VTTAHRIGGRLVEELILAALDATSDPGARADLKAHLVTCATCATMDREHRRIAQRLARVDDTSAPERVSLARVRIEAARPTHAPAWRRGWQLGVTAALVTLIVGGFVGFRTGAARPSAPLRETILERSQTLDGSDVMIVIEDGRDVALPGQSSGVIVRVRVRLATTTPGRAELRFAPLNEDYGVLASVSDTSGLGSFSMEGRFPHPDQPTVFDLWVHLERPEPLDTLHVRVEVDPIPGGERARAP
jgi:hypothetical protein